MKPEIVQRFYELKRPYSMIAGSAVVAEKVFERVGQFFYAANVDEPGAFVYFDPRDPKSDGFGGRTLTFKLTDGTEVNVKGPWHSNSNHLFQETGVDLRDKHKTWGLVARGRDWQTPPAGVSGNSSYYLFTDVYHLDKEPVVGRFNRIQDIAQDVADRLGEEVFYYSESHGGSSCGPVQPKGHECEKCGKLGTHSRTITESCPTDRGEEYRDFEVWLCDKCDPK